MSDPSSLDRESFQKLLASAFAVQESGLDTASLTALAELQRLIATNKPSVDAAMRLIADRVRKVANATGVAIAMLDADQLVYRAGSGSAATLVGRHMTAILGVSAANEARREILRVENAQTDTRIEADICRQFEAQSLLILPIYHEHAVAGVLQVLFDQPHAFEDREVLAYRLMTGLVEEALRRKVQLKQKKVQATQPALLPNAVQQITPQMREPGVDDGFVLWIEPESWTDQAYQRVVTVWENAARLWQSARTRTAIRQPVKRVPLRNLRWNVAASAVVAALVMAAGWIAYDRHRASPMSASSPEGSNVSSTEIPVVRAMQESSASNAQAGAAETAKSKAARSAFKRVRVGPNEVDDIADDVTIRHFTPKAAAPRIHRGFKEVNVGRDVTVRYFASKPAVVSQTRPMSGAADAAASSLPVSK